MPWFKCIVDDAHRCHLTATIDALLYSTAADFYVGFLTYHSSPFHWVVTENKSGVTIYRFNSGIVVFTYLITTVATAIDIAVHGTAAHGDVRIVTHNTHLTTTIDITLNQGSAADLHGSSLCLTQLRPQRVRSSSVQQLESSHAAAVNITTLGVVVALLFKFKILKVVTDDTTADVDRDMTMAVGRNLDIISRLAMSWSTFIVLSFINFCLRVMHIFCNILRELTIAGICRSVESDTY